MPCSILYGCCSKRQANRDLRSQAAWSTEAVTWHNRSVLLMSGGRYACSKDQTVASCNRPARLPEATCTEAITSGRLLCFKVALRLP
eukprot:15434282-Alexandrium_andersonii.AAC.1